MPDGADSLEDAGDRLFIFTRVPFDQCARPAPPMPSNGWRMPVTKPTDAVIDLDA